jgi:hypothetical protein
VAFFFAPAMFPAWQARFYNRTDFRIPIVTQMFALVKRQFA